VRGSQQIRILVVDDELDNAELFKALLDREGYAVSTLQDPTKVVSTLKNGNFHLVILDLMMPQMNGTEVLERIRSFDDDIAVIVATGFPTVESAVASLQLSASDYVKKPVDPPVLLETVRRTLAKKGITRDPEAELHRAIGRSIREGRTRQNLTLKQLARRTGLSVSLLSQIERAESSASISSLYRIANALRVRMSELFADV
jgi:DNA-binding NtrC family response regulator